MKKLLILISLLSNISYSYSIDNKCCSANSTYSSPASVSNSSGWYRYYYYGDLDNTYHTIPDYGVLSSETLGNSFVGVCTGDEGYYGEYSVGTKYDSGDVHSLDPVSFVQYVYVCNPCDENSTVVNNECVPKTQIDCKAEHGFDWVTDDAVDASVCGSKVDGVVIDAGTWHDPDTNHNVGVCCLHPKKPNYDCSLKGVGWQGVQADSIDDCLSKADNILFDSASVESGDTISTTCCVHAIDNGEIHTPTTQDGNDTIPMKNDSEAIKNAVDNGTNQAHEDANQAHQDAVSNGNQAHEDANQAHEDAFAQQTSLNYIGQSIDSLRTESSLSASNIKDSIDGVREDIGSLDNTLQGDPTKTPESELSNSGYGGEAITDFIQGLSTQLASLGGRLSSAPHVQPSTVGCVESVDTSYGVFSLDVGSMADTLATPLSLLWSLLLIYFNFKIYLFIFFKLIERV